MRVDLAVNPMLPNQLLGDDAAGFPDLYEALRFLVDRALLTGEDAVQGKVIVRAGQQEGMFEVYARHGGNAGRPAQEIPLFTMDELDFRFERFVEMCPQSLEEAVERALLGARTSA